MRVWDCTVDFSYNVVKHSGLLLSFYVGNNESNKQALVDLCCVVNDGRAKKLK